MSGADQQRQARRAGLFYLLVAVIAPLGLFYVPGQLLVADDAAATAAALRAGETLLRAGMASELIHQAIEVFLVVTLYGLFKPVHAGLARQMLIFGAIPIPIVFLNVLSEIAASMLAAGGPALASFAPSQLDALAYLCLRLHGQGLAIATVFWGLWLLPLAALIMRSDIVPRFVGVCAALAGIGYVLDASATVLAPPLAAGVSPFALPLQVCELVLIGGLLLCGFRWRGRAATA